jgi:hypothetical protein
VYPYGYDTARLKYRLVTVNCRIYNSLLLVRLAISVATTSLVMDWGISQSKLLFLLLCHYKEII